MIPNVPLSIAPDVADAIARQRPIVALESTIISHGMPYPQNVETALAVENIIKAQGATPATIAIIKGQIHVGLDQEQIDFIGHTDNEVQKVSRRDLPIVLARHLHGATTVAATMIIAKMAGIKIFATGGIGGVHRGAEQTMDISADLQELANTNVTVISAGVKSILDLGLTLEYLETYGVPVIGYQTTEFPAFYSRRSGLPVPFTASSPTEIANILHQKDLLGFPGGCVIANPIPESDEMEYQAINEAIEVAINAAKEQEIKGKAITPFLLNYIKTFTKGKSLEANIKLVFNNAKLAAQIAVARSNMTM